MPGNDGDTGFFLRQNDEKQTKGFLRNDKKFGYHMRPFFYCLKKVTRKIYSLHESTPPSIHLISSI